MEPRAGDGTCARETVQHPPDLKETSDTEGTLRCILHYTGDELFYIHFMETLWNFFFSFFDLTSRRVGGVGIAILQLSRPLRHQWRRGGILGVGQGVSQHHRLPDFGALNCNLLLPLPGHKTLQLLQKRRERALYFAFDCPTPFSKCS